MAELVLVRHGQASFGAADYDKLSDLGWRQSRWLGEYFAERGITFPAKTTQYSVNEGMWGASVGGRETLNSWDALPESVYPGGALDPARAPRTLVIGFERGVPVELQMYPMARRAFDFRPDQSPEEKIATRHALQRLRQQLPKLKEAE